MCIFYCPLTLTHTCTRIDASESSSPVIHRPNPDVNKRITKLKIKFADLLLETHKFLYESNVSIQEFRIFVSFLSASNDNRSSLYFRDHLPSISSASTLDQIFAILNENQYWNHFNYHLLEAVVEKYGNEKIRKLLSHYAEEVSDFQSSVSLSDYCVTLPFADRVPSKPDFTRIITRQEESWTDYSLKKVHDMHSSLCGEFDLPKHALMFQMADKGSVMIRYCKICILYTCMHSCLWSSDLHIDWFFILCSHYSFWVKSSE